MTEWKPCPPTEDGFYLVYEDEAMRTMMFFDGKWDHPGSPVMVTEFGDHLTSPECERAYGRKLQISDCIYEPTHWAELPEAPKP